MVGTFNGALAAHNVTLNSNISAEVRGEVESDDGVLVIKRIIVSYSIDADESDHATIERVHGIHADYCPVYRSLKDAIAISSKFVFV